MLTALEIDKRIQSVEDTIGDIEFRILELGPENDLVDELLEKLAKYQDTMECLLFKRKEFDMWCFNHRTITSKETEKDWYSDCETQLKLDIWGGSMSDIQDGLKKIIEFAENLIKQIKEIILKCIDGLKRLFDDVLTWYSRNYKSKWYNYWKSIKSKRIRIKYRKIILREFIKDRGKYSMVDDLGGYLFFSEYELLEYYKEYCAKD